MTRTINGKRGASIDSILAKSSEPVPLVEALEKSIGQIKWRRLGTAMRDRKSRKGTSNEQRK